MARWLHRGWKGGGGSGQRLERSERSPEWEPGGQCRQALTNSRSIARAIAPRPSAGGETRKSGGSMADNSLQRLARRCRSNGESR
jgi:hypothetical protein